MNKEQDAILVTGATGQQGGAVAHALRADGYRVAAMTRNPDSDKARALAELGADIVQADLDDDESLRAALAGKWGVFAVQNSWEAGIDGEIRQGKRIAELAKEAGVQHFVYTSVASADRETGIPHFDSKFEVEKTLRALGFPSYVILRPVFFLENLLMPDTKNAVADGSLPIGIPSDRKLQVIALQDIGAYGKLAFEKHEELNGRAIDIAGDDLTAAEMAATLSSIAGREIGHFQVPIDQVRAFSEDFALMLEWFDDVGYSVDIGGNEAEYGIPATSFSEWAGALSW
jgi:uncharacterized protein YbjT (DUF2867 family)